MSKAQLPPLSSLKAFEAAARHLSFSEAGREMNVTHAAVAQQVRRLEEWLGLSLLFREGRGLALTDQGRLLASRLTQGFETMQEGLDELNRREAGRSVSVTTTPSFASSWLMPRLGAFRSAHPEIEFLISPSPHLVDLKRDGFDLAIRFGHGKWEGMEVERLVPARFSIVAAKSLLKGREIEKPEDLADFPWIHELGVDELGTWLRSRGLENIQSKQGILHLPGHMVLQALREGQGVACTASVFVQDDLEQGRLVALFESGEQQEETGYHLVRRPGPLRGNLKTVVDWLRQEARADLRESNGPGV